MSAFRIPSDRQPLVVSGTNLIDRVWFLFLQGMFQRIGGATGDSAEDLSDEALQTIGTLPSYPEMADKITELESQVASLNAQLAELKRFAEASQSGLTF